MNIQKETKVSYFNPETSYSSFHFIHTLRKCCKDCFSLDKNLVILCIGSDRVIGDCLGPLVGHKLSSLFKNSDIHVYGTLKNPVHAKNLDITIKKIRASIQNPYIIALDSSLGTNSHVGCVTLGKGALHPGIGTGKNLPHVGDIFITGIVNESGLNNISTLQTTHLATVVKLADFISTGVYMSVRPSKAR
ncbi:spore protease YyaC [Eubacterium sp. MSJ-13]|uniref:spore protease YyaC n=1 Tax=Eubacterium sp. MSJ-13 TaxID=2841513 RepID=UPI001C116973|nr:spore protease YyaC [Eubacterium sp. MSJ-13]MBU5478434.1 spore protease YyaC [Eubacterium sp. MSJ-13]